jgi:AraC-like DNA-binding protein
MESSQKTFPAHGRSPRLALPGVPDRQNSAKAAGIDVPSTPPDPEYLALDQLQPLLTLSGYWEFDHEHWHTYRIPGLHFLLIDKGAISAKTPHGEFKAKAGDMLCFRATDHNEYGNIGRTHFYQIHIEFAPPPRHHLTPWLDDAGPLPIHLQLGPAHKSMVEVFEIFCLELPRNTAAAKTRIMSAIWRMLSIITEIAKAAPAEIEIDRWQRARMRLSTELTSKMSLGDFAKDMGMTVDHFIRIFKKRFGQTPKAYHMQAKLRYAAQALQTTDTSVKELAHRLGFEDDYSFTRAFKQYFAVLPSTLRSGEAKIPSVTAADEQPVIRTNEHVIPSQQTPEWWKRFTSR